MLSKLINRFVQGPLCGLGAAPQGWAGSLEGRVHHAQPTPGSPQLRDQLCPWGCPGQVQLGQGWLQECKDFCDFYINNTLIPLVVQAGPLGVHVCGPCTPSSASPIHMGRSGRDFPLLGPGCAAQLQSHSSPAWCGRGGRPGSGLGLLQEPQQGLCDAQEVDHLSNAKQRSDDQGAAVGTLQEGRGTLIPQDLPVEKEGSELVPASPAPLLLRGLTHLAQSRNPE